MVKKDHPQLSIRRQCVLLGVNRATYYKPARGESEETLALMKEIDQLYLKYPFYGARRMQQALQLEGIRVGRHRIRRLMKLMGIEAIYQRPRTSKANPEHKIYPYLLRGLDIHKPNQVWTSDITYIPMKRGFMYLTAVMDWYSRKVLSWRLSNTLETSFCLEALEEAVDVYGVPDIFNTDQGAQYTSHAFTNRLQELNVRISMDSKGRWLDNVMIERLWSSVKYESIYLQEFESPRELKQELTDWFRFYNDVRPHSTFAGRRPSEMYNEAKYKNAA